MSSESAVNEQNTPEHSRHYPVQVVGAAIVDSLKAPTRLLVARRSAPASLVGLWEFPGGKVEPGESDTAALVRELEEELGVQARLGSELTGPHEQGWVLNQQAAMRVFFTEIVSGQPQPLQDHNELLWVPLYSGPGSSRNSSSESATHPILALEWIGANYPIITALLQTLDIS